MSADVNEAERAYRDGQIDAKLAAHEAHLGTINGSIERTGAILTTLERAIEKVSDQVLGLTILMPKIHSIETEVETAKRVAEALRLKALEERTTWDRYRTLIAWSLGVLIALTTLTNLTLNHL